MGPRTRVLGFLALYAAFTVLWQALAETPLLPAWIEGLIVPAAALWLDAVSGWAGGGGVQAAGARLASPEAVLNVLPGCEGSDAMALVAVAAAVAPRPGRVRLLGAMLLVAAVFVLNQARLALLLWALPRDRALFESLHTLWLPLALMVASAALFMGWLAATAPRGSATPPPGGAALAA